MTGIVATVALLVFIAVVFSGVFRKPFEPDYRTVSAVFERAPQLRKGDQVRLEGNVEGKVSAVRPGPSGEQVEVRMHVERDAGPVYADARARLGFKTLLGGVFYVDLNRGTSGAGELGDRAIGIERTTVQHELEDLTTVFREGAVSGLRTLPGELATGLSDADVVADDLTTLGDIAPDTATGAIALRGQLKGYDLPRLVNATSRTLEALDTGNDDIRTLVAGAATTLRTVGRRDQELRESISSGPSVTRDLTGTFARLDGTLDRARGLVARLQGAAPDVAPTLAELRPTLPTLQTVLDDARPLVATLPGTLDTLAGAGRDVAAIVPRVRPALQRIDEQILPYLAREDEFTGKSTTVMIGGFLAGFGGSAAQQDSNGHFIRFPASIGASSAYLPCSSNVIDPDAQSQLACDSFNEAVGNYLNYLPDTGSPQETEPDAG